MYILCDCFTLDMLYKVERKIDFNRILSTLTNDIENVISNLIYMLSQEW